MVRIDHFRGFDEYYAIPYGEETAVNGAWEKGPGILLFDKINEVLGEQQIIAEDLGFSDGQRPGSPGADRLPGNEGASVCI